jgi:NitT/TauT family transport system permease protein
LKGNTFLRQVLFYVGFLALWQALASSGLWPEKLLPRPSAVAESLRQIAADGSLWQALRLSLARVLTGYLLACVLGLVLGMMVFQYRVLSTSFGSMVPGLLSLPAACWLPLATIWFSGQPEYAIQLMIVLGAVFSIAHATETGMRNVQPVLVRAARTMGSTGWGLSFKVLLPAALPAVLTGLKQGWAFAWRALMAGELLSTTLGFGNLLKKGQKEENTAALMALILVIMALSYAVNFLIFAPAERRLAAAYGTELPPT